MKPACAWRSKGLPKGGAVGFELLDQEKFGISQFSEQINYQRALEGELSRTIESLGPVQNARVHLALPKPSLFVREQKSPFRVGNADPCNPDVRWTMARSTPSFIWCRAASPACRRAM